MAAGLFARGEQTLEYGRDVTLYVHLAEDSPFARTENKNRLVTVDQVRDWCQTAGTRVVVKPVIDLNEQIRVDAYEIPDRLVEQVALEGRSLRLPLVHPTSPGCDTDHVTPYQPRRTHQRATTLPPCADITTASRPTAPGPTP